MFGDYSEEAMQRINARLGAGHRVKPYDLTSAADLKQALLVTVAAYRDYWNYKNTLIELEENYDESLEYCDTASWLDMGCAPEKADVLTVEGMTVLNAASDVFDKLTERAKRNCVKIVKAVLSAPPATQKTVFGHEYKIEPQGMDARIDELFDMLDETDYHHSMPENLNAFLEVMNEQWNDAACMSD